MSLQPYLRRLMETRHPLSRNDAREVLTQLLTGLAPEVEIAALLGALAAAGETAAEIAGFADVMRAAAVPLPLTEDERSTLIDTCGTGGDASGTFNISTAAALVAAAAGATVAKHGNRAVTSRSGSADVLEALGIAVDLTPIAAAQALRLHRFAFLHAPALHPAMRAVMPVRRALGVRTIFNVVGPLANPAGARRQVVGVYAPHLVPIVADALALLGTERALVVHGAGSFAAGPSPGIDELSLSGPSQIAEVRDGVVTASTVLDPRDLGLRHAPLAALRGGDVAVNAQLLRVLFAGEPGPRRDIVVLNAGAVLLTAGCAADLLSGMALAAQAIDSGAVSRLIEALQRTP